MEKSAISDHRNTEKHKIDWEGARVVERESYWRMCKTKEAIQIRLQGRAAMNRDQGYLFPGSSTRFFAEFWKHPRLKAVTRTLVSRMSTKVDETVSNKTE